MNRLSLFNRTASRLCKAGEAAGSVSKQKFANVLLRLLAGSSMLLALGMVAQAQDDERKNASPSPSIGAITGRVVNDNGQPIPHATIYVSAPSAVVQSRASITDDGGNFQVRGLDALVYTMNVSAPSFVTAPRDPESPPSYYRIGDSLTINMIRGGVITGTVTSPTGEPVVQIGVRAILVRDANGKSRGPGRFAIDKLTDDRGMYRIYGLAAGTYLVSAGGRGNYGFSINAYDTDAPTYAPSSTRDAAAEITVRAGEEASDIDIRYRGEPGHAISGFVSGPVSTNSFSGTNITLTQVVGGVPQISSFSFQPANTKGFAFYGVPDGDYDLIAQSSLGMGEAVASEPRRITVKGADITGIELTVKTLSSISGQIALEHSNAVECKNKRQPSFSETLLVAHRIEKNTPREPLAFPNFFAQTSPNQGGDFVLRNLAPGPRNLSVRFFAKYWYLRSMVREAAPASRAVGKAAGSRKTDVARNGISLKFGERISGVTVTLAEGAASLRGAIKPGEGESVPAKLYLNLVPAEKESAEDVLRFFTAPVQADGKFAVSNVAPGRYWVLARISANDEPQFDSKLRAPEEAETRAQIRREAEAAKTALEFKPCQNVSNYELPFAKQKPYR
ncbi:MAG TPA: carboxypeptidase-like regulatory domain-containing protein [Pyrinomonadaceae bacterium]|jgi:hypothetical protein|nr:carboxypeptidase-like regulatory domain-containing protein [Pyrinomonadaceae bacterium]